MSRGMVAVLMGIACGFLVLIGAWLMIEAHDAATGAVCFAIAGSLAALSPLLLRRGRGRP